MIFPPRRRQTQYTPVPERRKRAFGAKQPVRLDSFLHGRAWYDRAVTSPGAAAVVADRGVAVWFGHIDYLARVIGPRGSCTAGEAEAARYAHEQFKRAGLEPPGGRFPSASSARHPFAL